MRPFLLCLLVAAGFGATIVQAAQGVAEHVVLIVWDGFRPDFVTKENTPTLFDLADRGVRFANHHAVFPSMTEVNGAAVATGLYPEHNGIIGNREYRPSLNADGPVPVEDIEIMKRGDELTGGHYLGGATIAELVAQAGFPVAVAGTKPVALIQNRRAATAKNTTIVFQGKILPEAHRAAIEEAIGRFPEKVTFPNSAEDQWTARALDQLWKKEIPKFSVLWLSDPDYTQHEYGPGSPQAIAALQANDSLVAKLLETLKARGVADKTDVLLVSDHGFSTIERGVDVAAVLREAGFNAFRKFLKKPSPGDVILADNRGTVYFYVVGHDRTTIQRLVAFLQKSDFAGVIFTKESFPGTFSLAQAMIDSPNAPDVAVSLAWNDGKNAYGVQGLITSDQSTVYGKAGRGMHCTLSRFDMHNTFLALGPDFRAGFVNEMPTGNVDIAPTILWILGIQPPAPQDGRVLAEALVNPPFPPLTTSEPRRLEATADLPEGQWHQYLETRTVGRTVYLDQGNGAFSKNP